MNPPDQLKPSVEAPKPSAEATPAAPKEAQDPVQKEAKEARRGTVRGSAEGQDGLKMENIEKAIDTLGDKAEAVAGKVAGAVGKGGALSGKKFENFTDTLTKGTSKVGSSITSIFDKLTPVFEGIKKALSPMLTKLAPLLKKMGIDVPEWMMDRIPGMKELENVATQKGRTLLLTDTDGATMRKLLAIHNTLEKDAKGEKKAYTVAEFYSDIITAVPADKNDVSLKDLETEAERIIKKKEEAKQKKDEGKPAEETKTTEEKKAPEIKQS